MALLPQKANTPDNSEGLGDRTPMKPGDYLAAIYESDYKATKAGTGHYLAIRFKIADGPHKGRVQFANLNLDNPSAVAMDIANKELNSICQACGLAGVEDSQELHGIPMLITLKINPGDANYPPSNDIAGYKVVDSSYVPQEGHNPATDATTPTDPVDSAPAKKLPWD
jgi:hypothetical protein